MFWQNHTKRPKCMSIYSRRAAVLPMYILLHTTNIKLAFSCDNYFKDKSTNVKIVLYLRVAVVVDDDGGGFYIVLKLLYLSDFAPNQTHFKMHSK